jgi:sugar phosphate isomerase/epimerase
MYKTIKLLALPVIMALLISCSSEKVYVPDPGVVSYTFRTQFAEDVPGTLDMIKEMGITNIEFSNLFGKTPSEMKALLDERNMICTSYGIGYGRLVDEPLKVAEEAKILGAKYVRVASIPYERPEFTIDNARKTVEDFNAGGKILRENGIYFCYHNHGFEFRPYGDGTLFDYIVQNTNPEYVSFEMDLLWTVHPGQDPVALLEKYPDRFRLMHLKDLRKGVVGDFSGGTPRENDVVLGTGQVDFPAVLKAAANTNIEYYYIEDESPDVIERVPQSREFIMSIKK